MRGIITKKWNGETVKKRDREGMRERERQKEEHRKERTVRERGCQRNKIEG